MANNKMETAFLGGGCFWCQEALFLHIKGVVSVVSGYAGGTAENPTYEQVCSGNTGHAEVVRIDYDPEIISFKELLYIFFYVHDPTTKDRQGSDVGAQYRSIILFTDEKQKQTALQVIKELEDKKAFKGPIVTEVAPSKKFYMAEEYHQRYFEKNPERSYCQAVIAPEIKKLEKEFLKYYK